MAAAIGFEKRLLASPVRDLSNAALRFLRTGEINQPALLQVVQPLQVALMALTDKPFWSQSLENQPRLTSEAYISRQSEMISREPFNSDLYSAFIKRQWKQQYLK